MKNLFKQYKSLKKEIAEAKTALSNIETWKVSELEKIQERSTINKMLKECETDLKIVLSQMAEQANRELSKMCQNELAA